MKKNGYILLPALVALLAMLFSCTGKDSPVGPSLSQQAFTDDAYEVLAVNPVEDFEPGTYPAAGLQLVLPSVAYPSGDSVQAVYNPYTDSRFTGASNSCYGFYWKILLGGFQNSWWTADGRWIGATDLYSFGNAIRFRAKAVMTNGMPAGMMAVTLGTTSDTVVFHVTLTGQWKTFTVPFDEMRTSTGAIVTGISSALAACTEFKLGPAEPKYILNQEGFYLVDDIEIIKVIKRY